MSRQARPYDASRWFRWSRFIQRRPWVAAIGGLAVLLALAAPFLGIRFGFPDAENDAPTSTSRQAYDLLADGFGPGFSAPMVLTVQGATGDLQGAADAAGRHSLGQVDGVAYVAPAIVNEVGDTAVLTVTPTTSPQDAATEDARRPPARRRDPHGHRGHRPDGPRRRHDRGQRRLHPGDR